MSKLPDTIKALKRIGYEVTLISKGIREWEYDIQHPCEGITTVGKIYNPEYKKLMEEYDRKNS